MTSRIALSVLSIAALGLSASAAAHDFWLEPEQFVAGSHKSVHVDFMVGHAGDRGHWNLQQNRIVSLQQVSAAETKDVSTVTMGREGGGARVAMAQDSAILIGFESNNAYIELYAEKFNSYLEEEGLTAVQDHRRATAGEAETGREYYSRAAKTIISKGAVDDGEHLTKTLGHRLEIRPLENPLTLADDAPLSVEILYLGEPLPGALVSLENIRVDMFPEKKRKTDSQGHAAFAFPKQGAWKLNVVWSQPVDDEKADYETVFSSLTFSYD
ncbi:DUF4198 domain-containing protein [Hyphococcus flavus]|uniref:DUF4198 domain-containing protein n=1 Tax=Hyphococcus flavus TaxID=1866326 RepID=A0AAF0CIA7_9PROT|nr:DUF4198 domain-containing protein [Hyphococcus flavus]WDI32682.1 DUF4198 domain-containing protein [Hyphococcus flavus]